MRTIIFTFDFEDVPEVCCGCGNRRVAIQASPCNSGCLLGDDGGVHGIGKGRQPGMAWQPHSADERRHLRVAVAVDIRWH